MANAKRHSSPTYRWATPCTRLKWETSFRIMLKRGCPKTTGTPSLIAIYKHQPLPCHTICCVFLEERSPFGSAPSTLLL
ncbi:hypothetical protein ETC05_06650 [Geobacillus sp. BMUD]|nr:hypothetical protein [Geobacillus sp. BMUD]